MTSQVAPAVPRSVTTMTVRAIQNVGGPLTVLVALVTDVLAPLGRLTLGLAGLALFLFVVISVVPRFVPRMHSLGERCFGGYWRRPMLASLAVAIGLLLAAHEITASAPAGGWLGTHVDAVRELQSRLGVIDAQTGEIAKKTQAIKEDTEEIKAKLDELADRSSGEPRTDGDPRKELASQGVTWSTGSFVEALQTSDARTVRLFLDGGMSPTVLHEGASAVLYVLQAQLPNPVPMLELMVAAGFDLDENLVDGRILRHYSEMLPPHFESPDLPSEYAAWQGTFGGPALLWLVIRSAYGITDEWDVDTIEFLKRNGADTGLTRQFLVALEYAWGDSPTYQRVRAAVD